MERIKLKVPYQWQVDIIDEYLKRFNDRADSQYNHEALVFTLSVDFTSEEYNQFADFTDYFKLVDENNELLGCYKNDLF